MDSTLQDDSSDDEFIKGPFASRIHNKNTKKKPSNNSIAKNLIQGQNVANQPNNSLHHGKKRQNTDNNFLNTANPKRSCLQEAEIPNESATNTLPPGLPFPPCASACTFNQRSLRPDTAHEDFVGGRTNCIEPKQRILDQRENPFGPATFNKLWLGTNMEDASESSCLRRPVKNDSSDDELVPIMKMNLVGGKRSPEQSLRTKKNLSQARELIRDTDADDPADGLKVRRLQPFLFSSSSDSDTECVDRSNSPVAVYRNAENEILGRDAGYMMDSNGHNQNSHSSLLGQYGNRSSCAQSHAPVQDSTRSACAVDESQNRPTGIQRSCVSYNFMEQPDLPIPCHTVSNDGRDSSDVEFFTTHTHSEAENSRSFPALNLQRGLHAGRPRQRVVDVSAWRDDEDSGSSSSEDEISVVYSTAERSPGGQRRLMSSPTDIGRRRPRSPRSQPTSDLSLISMSPDPVELVRQVEEDERFAMMLQAQFDSELPSTHHHDEDSDTDVLGLPSVGPSPAHQHSPQRAHVPTSANNHTALVGGGTASEPQHQHSPADVLGPVVFGAGTEAGPQHPHSSQGIHISASGNDHTSLLDGRIRTELHQLSSQANELQHQMSSSRRELDCQVASQRSELSRQITSRANELRNQISSRTNEMRNQISSRANEMRSQLSAQGFHQPTNGSNSAALVGGRTAAAQHRQRSSQAVHRPTSGTYHQISGTGIRNVTISNNRILVNGRNLSELMRQPSSQGVYHVSTGNNHVMFGDRQHRTHVNVMGFSTTERVGGQSLHYHIAAPPTHAHHQHRAAGPPVVVAGDDGDDEDDEDSLPFEAILDLEDQIGVAVQGGLHESEIERLPTRTYTGPLRAACDGEPPGDPPDGGRTDPDKECSVCLMSYMVGELLRILPCFHVFHAPCIDAWLKMNRSCPVCRIVVDVNNDD